MEKFPLEKKTHLQFCEKNDTIVLPFGFLSFGQMGCQAKCVVNKMSDRQIVKQAGLLFLVLRNCFLTLVVVLAATMAAAAVPSAGAPLNDGIDRYDPNFVKASLLVMGPGAALYSCAGHICFRLECPTFKHDFCFSYEGESASDQVLKFFAGELKMGMFCVPTPEFLKQYEKSGRGVRQYVLNLSPAAKVRLWKGLDDLVAKGPDLPYDYIKRGCAQSTLHTLLTAIRPELMEPPSPSEKFKLSRREILHSYIADYPWTRVMLHMISGPEADYAATDADKIITPDDMLVYLRGLKVNGQAVLTAEPVELFPQTLSNRQTRFTPMMASLLVVVLSLLGCFWKKWFVDVVPMAVYAAVGFIESYIVFFSALPASSWNWLLIPFNPLPIVFWHWRRYWALPFAGVLVVWEAFMLFNGHQLTDPSFLVLTLAYLVFCLRFVPRNAFRGLVPAVPQTKGATA